MPGNFACVSSRKARRHPAYSRYIAVLDVLGMKSWLRCASAQWIAESLDEALAASDQASMGDTIEGEVYGPLIGVTHFSDSLLMWSPDDSWPSLFVMCNAVKMLVGSALSHGTPLRGAIALGEAVCQPTTMRFVGAPIAEAFVWAEKERQYRSVGVDITPKTLASLRDRLSREPIPDLWRQYDALDDDVIVGTESWSKLLMWHTETLLVNHWAHGTFLAANVTEMFLKRALPTPPEEEEEVQRKIQAMEGFARASRSHPRAQHSTGIPPDLRKSYLSGRQEEYLRLDTLKRKRDCPTQQ